MNFEDAVYHDVFLEDFTGNPLVECLPPEVNPKDYPGYLLVTPPYSEENRYALPQARLQYLQRIAQVHIEVSDTSTMLVLASNDRCSGRSTDRIIIELPETDTFLRQSV